MVVNGNPFGMWGFPGFVATTFTSTLGANGILAVYGSAVGYGSFNLLTSATSRAVASAFPMKSTFCSVIPSGSTSVSSSRIRQRKGSMIYDLQGMVVSSGPVPLINQPLEPESVAPGSAGFTLTVNGTGFVSNSVVNWNTGTAAHARPISSGALNYAWL
jgi:hypothetical protein